MAAFLGQVGGRKIDGDPARRQRQAGRDQGGAHASRIRSRSKARIRQCLWPEWGVLIGGSTGSALRAVRPPNCYITPDARCDLVNFASVDEHQTTNLGVRSSKSLGRATKSTT